ncbi:MAG: AI-2E family transporter [Polyangiales bacterium]
MSPPAERDSLLAPVSGPGSRRRRRWFLGVSGVLCGVVLVVFHDVLLPFLLGLVVAYVLSPVVEFGEQLQLRGRRPRRWVVVVSLYLTLIGLLVSFISFSGPRLVVELGRLSKEAPRAVETIRRTWLPELDRRVREATDPYLAVDRRGDAATASGALPKESPGPAPAISVLPRPGGGYEVVLPPGGLRVVPEGERAFRVEPSGRPGKARTDLATAVTLAVSRTMDTTEHSGVALLQTAQSLITKLVRGIFGFVLTIVVSAYLLVTSARIFEFARSLYPPERRPDFDDLVRRIDRGLTGVVRGQLIICGINGVLSGIGFYLLGVKYWTFLALLAAVMSIVPIFGSILSSIPAVLVALTQDFGLALLVLAWIVGIHQLEANVLNPKIMGDSARVHPVLVVFALLAGEQAAGLVGALLAVPVLSIIQTLFLYLRERFLGVPRNSSVPPAVPEPPRAAADRVPAPDASRAR